MCPLSIIWGDKERWGLDSISSRHMVIWPSQGHEVCGKLHPAILPYLQIHTVPTIVAPKDYFFILISISKNYFRVYWFFVCLCLLWFRLWQYYDLDKIRFTLLSRREICLGLCNLYLYWRYNDDTWAWTTDHFVFQLKGIFNSMNKKNIKSALVAAIYRRTNWCKLFVTRGHKEQ